MLQWGCSWFDRTHFMGLCSPGESQSGAGIENGDLLYYWPMSPTMLDTGRDMSVGRRRFWEKGKHRCLLHLSNVATEISLFSFPSTWLPAFLLFIFFASSSSSCSLSLSPKTGVDANTWSALDFPVVCVSCQQTLHKYVYSFEGERFLIDN